jgi:hypothetical protein
MGNLKDLIGIFEAYKKDIVEELNIGVPQGGSALYPTTDAQPSNSHAVTVQMPAKDEDCEMVPPQEDHNIEMGRSEVFKLLKSGNELMNLLQTCTKLEPWQLSKLVKACDYVCAVKGSLEYDEFEKCQKDLMAGMRDIDDGMAVVSRIKDMLAGEDMAVNEEVLKQIIFNIECLKESKA